MEKDPVGFKWQQGVFKAEYELWKVLLHNFDCYLVGLYDTLEEAKEAGQKIGFAFTVIHKGQVVQ